MVCPPVYPWKAACRSARRCSPPAAATRTEAISPYSLDNKVTRKVKQVSVYTLNGNIDTVNITCSFIIIITVAKQTSVLLRVNTAGAWRVATLLACNMLHNNRYKLKL